MTTPYTVIYNNNNIISSVLQTEDSDFIKSQMNDGDQYKIFDNFQGYPEVNIYRFDDKGSWLSLEDQILKHFVPLEELATDEAENYILMLDQANKGQNYLDVQKILILIQSEIKYLGGEPFYGSEIPSDEEEETEKNHSPIKLSPEQQLEIEISQKQSEIFALREKFIDADIDDELELKETIKQEIKVKKQELAILEEQVIQD